MKNKITLQMLSMIMMAIFAVDHVNAQTINGQQDGRPVFTSVPFLTIAPDSRASGMGDVGAATSADLNSVHWNNGKLAFIDGNFGGSVSYSPWLSKIVNDMHLAYLSGYYRIDDVQVVGLSFRYFDLGEIFLTEDGTNGTYDNPREWALDGTYSRKLSDKWGIGVTGRFIASNLVGVSGGQDQVATSVAVDLGTYYKTDLNLGRTNAQYSFGAHISNIGQKLDYGVSDFDDANPAAQSTPDFIPINLRIGNAVRLELDPYNSLTFALDFNKLLVPTPPIYLTDDDGSLVPDNDGNPQIESGKDPDRNLIAGMFGSFNDAPDGFSEELKEIMISAGVEYWYRDIFAARLGHFREHDDKGGRKYWTLGLGMRYQTFGLDISYLIPGEQNNPLAETLRFSIMFNMKTEE